MIDLNPWGTIRKLRQEIENLDARVEAEGIEAQYWYSKAFQFKEDLQKDSQRIAELTKQVEILKDNAAELEMCCKELSLTLKTANNQTEEFERKWYLAVDEVEELKQQLAEALKNDHRDRRGRYAKGDKK